jgi:hypothetical protein
VTGAAWNLLLYTVAGNRKELEWVTHAIDDMQGAFTTNTTSPCNVAVQLHTKSRTTRHWISAGRKVRTETLPVVVDASDPSSLTSFLDAAHGTYSTAPSALVMWAHGSGMDAVRDPPATAAARPPGPARAFGERSRLAASEAGLGEVFSSEPENAGPIVVHEQLEDTSPRRPERFGCRWGPDPNTHHYLTNVGMKKAIATSRRHRVEVLGLNACSMASLEVAYELRSVSDVQVASQVEAEPWPYGAIITALAATPKLSAEQLAMAIVASVRAGIAGASKRSDTISAVLSGAALDDIVKAFDVYAKRVTALIEIDWKAVSKAVLTGAQRVQDPYQVDLMSLIHTLGKDDLKTKIAAASVDAKLRAALVAHAPNTEHPGVHGLSIFCPKLTHVDIPASYKGMEFRSHNWVTFLNAFQSTLARARA